jgi:hypothetical protein
LVPAVAPRSSDRSRIGWSLFGSVFDVAPATLRQAGLQDAFLTVTGGGLGCRPFLR